MSNAHSETPLTYKHLQAVRQGDIHRVTALLDKHPHLLNTRLEGHNRTLLWEATRFHRTDLVRFLLMSGADANISGRYRHETYVLCKPWVIAKSRGYDDLVKYLEPRTSQDIYSAAYMGDTRFLEILFQTEPGLVNERQTEDTLWYVTPLHHAVSGCQTEAVTWLIEHGAEINPQSKLLLDIALRRQRSDLVGTLLEHGADAQQAPVYSALLSNSYEIFSRLVTLGMDIHRKIGGRWPPLVYVCRGDKGQYPERVKWLLEAGANIQATAPHGMTALHIAARAGYADVVTVLLQAGADPHVSNAKGQTPYLLAKKSKRTVVMELLLAVM